MSTLTIKKTANVEGQAVEKSDCEASGLSLLEHLRASGEKNCQNPKAPILFGKDVDSKKAMTIRARCNMWNCPSCGARKANYWVARAINGVNQIGGQWYFGTLTAHELKRKGDSLKNLRDGWSLLYDRMKRRFGKFQYLKVFEHHEDGSYHLHLICNAEIPYTETVNKDGETIYRCRWLKDNARTCGIGYKADYQPIRSVAGVAYYVAKYVMKSIGDNGKEWAKNLRRIQPSHNFPKLPDLTEDSDLVWSYVKHGGDMVFQATQAQSEGYALYHPQGGYQTNPKKLAQWFNTMKDEFWWKAVRDKE